MSSRCGCPIATPCIEEQICLQDTPSLLMRAHCWQGSATLPVPIAASTRPHLCSVNSSRRAAQLVPHRHSRRTCFIGKVLSMRAVLQRVHSASVKVAPLPWATLIKAPDHL